MKKSGRFLLYMMVFSLVLITTGCNSRETFSEDPGITVTPSVDRLIKSIDNGPQHGGTLTLFTAPVDSLNPFKTRSRYVHYISLFIFEPLFTQIDENNVAPSLVKDWSHENFSVWQFSIREDVFFHHGQELTAYDVRHTLRILENFVTPFYDTSVISNILEVNVLNSHQLEIRLKEPDSTFLNKLVFPVLPQTMDNREKEAVMGTGPYRLQASDDTSVTLVRNDKWWKDAPYLDSIVFQIYPENKMVDAFQDNLIDIAFIKNVDFSKYGHRTDIDYQVYPDNEGNFLYVNPNSIFGQGNRQNALFRYVVYREHDMNLGQVQYFDEYSDEPLDIEGFREALIESGLVWNQSRGVFTGLDKISIVVPEQDLQKLHTANFLVNILEDAGIAAEMKTAGMQDVKRIIRNGGYDLSPVTEEIKPWESLGDTLERMQEELGYGRDNSYILPLYRNQQAILFKNHIRGEKKATFWNPYQGFETWYMPVFINESQKK